MCLNTACHAKKMADKKSHEFVGLIHVKANAALGIGSPLHRGLKCALCLADEELAEAVLSARAQGRRLSLGGWMEETPVSTPNSSRSVRAV